VKHLYLVRHGESEHHVRDVTGGWSDLPLTEVGHEQARRAAEQLATELGPKPFSLFSSDLKRAAQTAEAVARRLDVSVNLEPGLRELNNGRAAGLTSSEAKAIANPVTHPAIDWVPYPGAETWRQMTDRVAACMDRLERLSEETAVIVAHTGSGSALVKWWLRLPEEVRHGAHFEFRPASITELTENEWSERVVRRLNDATHLVQWAKA
jgi:broad specificity phosphatase PhoE